MRERVASVMNRFGTDMTLSNPEGTATVRGFFWAVELQKLAEYGK